MDDQAFLDTVESHIHHMFHPPFGDMRFLNQELFEYVLANGSENFALLDQAVVQMKTQFGDIEHTLKMRVDPEVPAIKVKIVTPTAGRKITITRQDIRSRAMETSEYGNLDTA